MSYQPYRPPPPGGGGYAPSQPYPSHPPPNARPPPHQGPPPPMNYPPSGYPDQSSAFNSRPPLAPPGPPRPPGPPGGNYQPGPSVPPRPPPPSRPPPQQQSNYPPPGNYGPPPNLGAGPGPGPGYTPANSGPPIGYGALQGSYNAQGGYVPPPPPLDQRNGRGDRGRGGVGRGGDGGRRRSPDGRQGGRPLGARDHELEDRLARERKCRTLFVRNVSYEADMSRLRQSFAEFGEIKEFFELVQKRGMVFITYFDLRIAERARDAMHGTSIRGRPIDVHYSLPKSEEQNAKCDRDKNQGSVLVTLRNSRHLDEYELRRACERFGEIRMVKPCRNPDQKIVEYFDSRGAVLFFDRMNGSPFMGGTLDLSFIWDELEPQLPPPPMNEPVGPIRHSPERERKPYRSGQGPGYGEVKGRRGSDRRTPLGNDRDGRGSYPPGPPPPMNRYGETPPGPPQNPGDDRLEQARKVQDLLASLGSAPTPTPGPPSGPPPSNYQPQPYAPQDPRQNAPRPPPVAPPAQIPSYSPAPYNQPPPGGGYQPADYTPPPARPPPPQAQGPLQAGPYGAPGYSPSNTGPPSVRPPSAAAGGAGRGQPNDVNSLLAMLVSNNLFSRRFILNLNGVLPLTPA